jgi:hypothetical protein
MLKPTPVAAEQQQEEEEEQQQQVRMEYHSYGVGCTDASKEYNEAQDVDLLMCEACCEEDGKNGSYHYQCIAGGDTSSGERLVLPLLCSCHSRGERATAPQSVSC